MRRALARLLAVALTLGLTSAVALAALSMLARPPGGGVELPFYFNPTPRNVHDLARDALRRITAGHDPEAERTLVRLGGAALPHVLPDLDTLAPSARGRVALALTPLARRMGVANEEDLANEDAAVGFWARFWQDRAFDFRPPVVKRLVGRLAHRSNALRYDDLVHLDTYAVGELLRTLGSMRTQDDVLRAERLTRVLAHVTGRGPIVDRQMSPSQAAQAVREWRRFAAEEGADFTTLDGPMRVLAMFTQTRYGSWFGRQVLSLRERSTEAAPTFGIGWPAASRSLLRFCLALLIAIPLGLTLIRLEIGTRRFGRLAAPPIGALLASLPAVFIARLVGSPEHQFWREALAIAIASLGAAALLSRLGLSLAERAASPPSDAALLRTELGAVPSILPWLTSGLFGLEAVFRLDGVAETVLAGLARSEVSPGISLAVVSAGLTAALISLTTARPPVTLTGGPVLVAVDDDKRRRLLTRGGAVVLFLVAGSLLAFGSPSESRLLLARGAESLLGYGLVTLFTATFLGISLGAFAVSGPVALDRVLLMLVEICSSLPALLWAAALARALGTGFGFAFALGCLRAPDLAWLFRTELMRLASADAELGARSLGRLPLSIYLRSRVWPAASVVLRGAALTPAWTVAVAVTAHVAGFSASAGGPGWDRLLSLTAPTSVAYALLAALVLGATSWFLVWAFGGAPRRVGVRSTRPPPPGP
ncbi:MAG: hypothetical protein ACOY0T_24260 [Myxococcota bacterium]